MSDTVNMDESQQDQAMNFLVAKNMGKEFTEALAKDPENPFLQGAAEVYGGEDSRPAPRSTKAGLWEEIFTEIWERSQTETGWVLLGDHVMTVLEEKGIVTKPSGVADSKQND